MVSVYGAGADRDPVTPRVYQPVPKTRMANGVSGRFSRLLLLNWLHWLSNTALRLDHLRYDEL
jgi:hypothetical protein